jgi:hypothetical protein
MGPGRLLAAHKRFQSWIDTHPGPVDREGVSTEEWRCAAHLVDVDQAPIAQPHDGAPEADDGVGHGVLRLVRSADQVALCGHDGGGAEQGELVAESIEKGTGYRLVRQAAADAGKAIEDDETGALLPRHRDDGILGVLHTPMQQVDQVAEENLTSEPLSLEEGELPGMGDELVLGFGVADQE